MKSSNLCKRVRLTITTLAFALLAVAQTIYSPVAVASLTSNPTHISIGVNWHKYASGAFEPYYLNGYNNDSDEYLLGLYGNFNINIAHSFILEGDGNFATKLDTGIDRWSLGAGYVAFNNGIVSLPLSCGVVNNHAATTDETIDHNKSEMAAYCKARLSAVIAPRWLADVAVHYEAFDNARTVLSINNTFDFSFSLFTIPVLDSFQPTFGIDFATRESSEFIYRFGVKFDFTR
jgi:hypothetical protein